MKKNYPTVSVIIPTYNRAHLIARAILSVLNQTFQDFELIIVDDSSTDNTEEVVNNFNDKKIRYIQHKVNKGGAAARNTGIKAAKGEFIAFQDSDDEWLPEKLEKQMKVFKTSSAKVGVVYTGFWRIESSKKIYIPFTWVTEKEGDIHDEILKGNFVTTQSAVVRRECFNKAGTFEERLPRFQDWELFIRISKYYCFKCIDEPLVISYYQTNSISADENAHIRAFELILDKHYEDFKRKRKFLAKHYCYIGSLLCLHNEIKKGRMYLIKAIKFNPLNLKFSLHIFFSLFGRSIYDKVVNSYRKIRDQR